MEAIVFDWDGTLIDSLPGIFEANLQVLAEHGVPFDAERYRAAYVPDWRLMYQRLGLPDDSLDAAGEPWLELDPQADAAQPPPPPGEALRRLPGGGDGLRPLAPGPPGRVGG